MPARAPPLTQDDAFAREHGLTLKELCERLYHRHRDRMEVKKPRTAVANLTRVLTATLRMSERHSFHEMSMRDLSRASGLSIGALYSSIRDKDTLLEMVLDVVSDAVDRVLVAVPEAVRADPRVHLRWIVNRHIQLTEALPAWFKFAYLEAKAFGPSARKRARQEELATERLIREALDSGVRQGVFKLKDLEMTAALIKPLLQEWYLKRWKYHQRGISPEAYADAVMNLLEGSVLG
ncbi:TetR/AcrR family transcriptional regulator [Hyalangium rubrum]|uniref:TetR/AcrR family transcriptional regulator n=1 Tax=Hyalangium rubrum TaxID=3103134 RepID=A0ABU5H1C2_9BACT|nr:TetR/AcrR family transcriptional regulator [Hyalangium sp. s54d21]MDY7226572.1 TetR/AcrR family transcriptional regulator [Hyalangium sp. s54d21]